jgi:hypothetical protein
MSQEPGQPFHRRAFFDDPALVGARWWQESLVTHVEPMTRRAALGKMTTLLISVGAIGLITALTRRREGSLGGDGAALLVDRDALELQRAQGWDVGHVGQALAFPGASATDILGRNDWPDRLSSIDEVLAPAQPALAPYEVHTLFQSLAAPHAETLRRALRPMHTPEMDAAFARGQAMSQLFASPEAPTDTAVLVDVPGPQAVAFAAGMADRFEPVFLFDNWPHPAGVVPSHQTLAAAVYHLPTFSGARASRPTPARPVFVADDQRLAHYTDQPDRFDNRYLLRLPGLDGFHKLEVRRLLYVRPAAGQVELDDLNADFVALAAAGMDIKMVALDDFSAAAEAPVGPSAPRYYWGGVPATHVQFWPTYGWSRSVSPPSVPPRVSSGATYRPVARPTLFTSHVVGGAPGVGRQKPTGFGRVSIRSGPTESFASGEGRPSDSGRSGSLGRSGSSITGG